MHSPTPKPPTIAAPAKAPASSSQVADARGRRTLSTALVRVGPDGHLTVELRNGRVLVLRNVLMQANKYCGVHVGGDAVGARYCGRYGEVAAARPGGGPSPADQDLAAAEAVGSPHKPVEQK